MRFTFEKPCKSKTIIYYKNQVAGLILNYPNSILEVCMNLYCLGGDFVVRTLRKRFRNEASVRKYLQKNCEMFSFFGDY